MVKLLTKRLYRIDTDRGPIFIVASTLVDAISKTPYTVRAGEFLGFLWE